MAPISRERVIRHLGQAEGYLLLDMPQRALEILQARADWPGHPFEAAFLTGEALRSLGRYREAVKPLEIAVALQPRNVGVAISLGWCYKRTHHLAQAIDALERVKKYNPKEALLSYNLACYWSLAGNRAKAVTELQTAIELDPSLRLKIADEPDFDGIRDEPGFERLATGRAPRA